MPPTSPRLETARAAYLHGLLLEIERLRKSGLTVRQAVRSVRRKRRKAYIRGGRLSVSRMISLFYGWRRERSPVSLERRYQGTTPFRIPLSLAEEFFNRLVSDRVVPASAVMQSLRADWRLGRAVPGLGTWRDWWRRRHGELSGRAMPPPFPVSRSSLYAFLGSRTPADYQRRISAALRAQRELNRFLDFVESRRREIARRRRHEPLG